MCVYLRPLERGSRAERSQLDGHGIDVRLRNTYSRGSGAHVSRASLVPHSLTNKYVYNA